MVNGCHGYLMPSSQSAKIEKISLKTYVPLKSYLNFKNNFLVPLWKYDVIVLFLH